MDNPYCEDLEFADGVLENIANWKRDAITLRQAEVLLSLRDNAEIHTQYKGLSICLLMERCYANRYELDEDDRRRLEALYEKNRSFVTGARWAGSSISVSSSARWKGICNEQNDATAKRLTPHLLA